uniref:Methyltransferase domain-containing protein n=1 Tax=Candidatus Kentrum sp. FM TaxID=2126340 RepID=A0A450SZK7_9GAMM|nr:MAG: Methyltransferase domain-containing protein [Candidatus Kentron sp. FM]VFJ61306.1 MAG: Methyltransferase domain-containing protein [Candidatus Kentron sp. FM]VFK13517.1 MAG: Methyltransferase domain-containing protein [Candidatus Kentron sp. FM]
MRNPPRTRQKKNDKSKTDKLLHAPPLSDENYAGFYEQRKNASTATVSTIEWLRHHAATLLEEMRKDGSCETFAILSVGSGSGEIDMEFIRAMSPVLEPHWNGLRYDALDPSEAHNRRFARRLAREPLEAHVEVSLLGKRFDPSENPEMYEQYDLVLLIQVLYYMDDPEETIRQALACLKPEGRIIIVHQSAKGIPQVQRKHMLDLKGDEKEILTTDEIKSSLDILNVNYLFNYIDARLDLTECLEQSDKGMEILSFCMECDLRALHGKRLMSLLKTLWSLAEFKEDGAALLCEPVGIFIVGKYQY